ncbi:MULTISPECIES: DUF4247 domain-containing protein [Bacillus]|uniref:DUF4247 domain-containing protein n=2 Tax=Bacillus toyonensis TaxID=155322 RepID=A0A1X3MNR9_9BACI|nr:MULTISPECIES: DUF4247 domain-containing protein [Bacillus]EJR68546.1 hypothetical protein IIO_00074 [Bacillus cereus VD115]EOP20487.1 lipoprotein [Bacillus cereus VD131]KAB0447081.1 DUF4247 domain-containing protein [Lysinibacillus sp. VIA-II-2016]KNH39175.1 lipoprotein [Bacillus thuringiensis]KXY22559.1 hypothetical protein AT259_28870 [Bacillus cereus]MDH8707158.1 hypothetical protein [Stenotrophomonas sp. 1198]OTX05102.1 hypothetical protein BK712_18245 [Bacillus thuringiensis serovar 
MSNRLFTMIKSFVIPILAIVILLVVAGYALSGCQGGQTKSIQDRYPLESVAKEGKQESYVYRAANRSVPEVAKELINEREPKQASKEDENQMFLVYSDKIYNLQKDKEKPSDTLIEISNKEFVRQNYQPSFLQGYIMGSILNDIFGSKKSSSGDYRGYNDRQNHKPVIPERPPTKEEKKTPPPITKEGKGSIIKRGDNVDSKSSVGDKGSITEKGNNTTPPPSTGSKGKITKTPGGSSGSDVKPKSSIKTPPRNTSPPKTRVGGSGKITKRR